MQGDLTGRFLILQSGVEFIASPAGSVADEVCIKAADEHGMTMVLTDLRLFHHWSHYLGATLVISRNKYLVKYMPLGEKKEKLPWLSHPKDPEHTYSGEQDQSFME